MKLSNLVKIIKDYPEKVIFGACVLVLLIVLVGYLTSGGRDELVSAVEQEKAKLDDALKVNSLVMPENEEYLKKIKGVWEEIQQPGEGKSWLMYRPPIIAVKFVNERRIEIEKKKNLAPVTNNIKTNDQKPDEIALTWSGNISSTAQIKSYKIYRRVLGEKSFTEIIEIPAVTSTERAYIYIDKGVKPETEYFYYFTAVSEDVNATRQESDQSEELKAVTLKDYRIEFKYVDEKNNRVWTKIEKYLNGKWEEKTGFIIKGDKIEKENLITGCTLTDFQPDVSKVSKGGGIIEQKTFRVFYLDKKGKEYSFLIPPK